MKLLTKELLAQFEKAGRQENVPDPVVIAKFFNPTGAGTWYATEYYPEEKMFFGYVSIFGDWNDEWGYVKRPFFRQKVFVSAGERSGWVAS